MKAASFQILRGFESPQEGSKRTLRIYLPPEYVTHSTERFGVLYAQDGQNVFDHFQTAIDCPWGVNTILESLVEQSRLAPWIVVGIDHGMGRFEDYSPWDEPREKVKAQGSIYASFLIQTLKPYVDGHYRTRPEARHTAVIGSSLGGLISLYLGWAHGRIFGRAGGLSPSVMWSSGRLEKNWVRKNSGFTRLYVDAGEHERLPVGSWTMEYGQAVVHFQEHLRGLGYSEAELRCVIDPNGQHHESDWRRRLPEMLSWLLSDPLEA